MKKILLVSDSHGKLTNLREVMTRVKPVDMVLHMGDAGGDEDEIRSFAGCPVEFVAGNCDWMSREPFDKTLTIENHRILMTHGHRWSAGYGHDGLAAAAAKYNAEIVFYGHTHEPDITYLDNVTIVNPGSISRPRQEGHRPTFGIFEIDRKGECHFTINYL